MSDEDLETLAAYFDKLSSDPAAASAASAIRQLMRERDEALVRVESLEDAWRYDRHRD